MCAGWGLSLSTQTMAAATVRRERYAGELAVERLGAEQPGSKGAVAVPDPTTGGRNRSAMLAKVGLGAMVGLVSAVPVEQHVAVTG